MNEDRLQELYLEATGLDEAGRRELLTDVAREFPELVAELERLLAFSPSSPSPIDGSPWRAGEAPAPAGLPARVGRFRILRELGRGGMGRVLLAEEESEHFRRRVALKLIDRPGLDEEAIRRFRAEVRILASLEHPGIARFLDGGQTPEGVWFLALEYVDGQDLIEHARAAALSVRERVELFAAVVDAVEHAHGQGVVHRDLKPSNVMVGRDGRPRLLDFGISKLVDAGGEGAAPTLTDWRPLTPAYASPEQFLGEPVSPRSDVFSLGVVLYELVAGSRPFASAQASRGALERAVLEGNAAPPSTAARRAASTGGRASTADSTTGRGARRAISRDLDAICLKALRREPRDRYASAAAFAADLRRYLGGEAVEARRGERRYRLRRLLRRRGVRLGVAAAGLALLLAAGVGYLSRAPGTAVATADESAPRAFPFDPVNPPPIEESEKRFAEAPDDFVAGAALALRLAREKRFAEAQIVVGRLQQIPRPEPEPLVAFTEGRLAALQGETQSALLFYTRARDQALAQGRGELVPTIRQARGALLVGLGQREAGRAELELARDEAERAGDPIVLFRSLNEIAVDHFQRGEFTQGDAALEGALAAAREAGLTPIIVLSNLAEVRLLRGRPDLAEPLAREALELRERFPSAHREGEETTRLYLILRDLGRSAEAEPLIERALALLRASTNAMSRSAAIYSYAQTELEDGRLGELDALAVELEAAAQESLRRRPLGFAHLVRAQHADLRGERAAARDHFAEARRLFLLDGDGDLAAHASLLRAESEAAAGDAAGAAAALDEEAGAFALAAATVPAYVAETIRARLEAAGADPAAARARLDALAPELERSPSVRLRLAFLSARATVALAQGRPGAARDDLATAIELARGSGRTLAELSLRLDLATAEADATAARVLAADVAREADALGLAALAERARAAAAETAPAAR